MLASSYEGSVSVISLIVLALVSGYSLYLFFINGGFSDKIAVFDAAGSFMLFIFSALQAAGKARLIGLDVTGIGAALITLSILLYTAYQALALIDEYKDVVEASEQEALRASEAKGKFLANMSHEIRTPINAVLGMDEMILREATEPSIREYASDIYSASHSLLAIINDILDISKIESGKMEIMAVDYDVSSMLHDTINMITPKAKEKGLKFNTVIASDIPSRLVGDDARLKQVMINILNNAVKYTEEGSVTFKVSWMADDDLLKCEVRDTGIGIKKEDIPKLFAEYERIEENRNRLIEGTGLGMSITMKMLSLMGSRLKVKSVYGKGSVFYFAVSQEVSDPEPIGDFNERVKNLAQATKRPLKPRARRC